MTWNQVTWLNCLFANVIPSWDGKRKISDEQQTLAGQAIAELVGRTAQKAWDRMGLQAQNGIGVRRSDHPGPLVRARYPERWNRIPDHWSNGGHPSR